MKKIEVVWCTLCIFVSLCIGMASIEYIEHPLGRMIIGGGFCILTGILVPILYDGVRDEE